MKEFGPLPKGAHCVGDQCELCGSQIKIGDMVCLVPIKPADEEEEGKMNSGKFYTAEACIVHKECKEKFDRVTLNENQLPTNFK